MKEIIVGMFEYRTATAPVELYTIGVGPCIAMGAIYGKKGYMFHAVSASHDFSIEPIFRDLRNDVKDKDRLKIYVIGGQIEVGDEFEEEICAGRQSILDEIAQNGFEECVREVRWCPPNHVQDLRLILSEGRAEIEEDHLTDILSEDDFY